MQLTIKEAIKDGVWLALIIFSAVGAIYGSFITFLFMLIASYKSMGGTVDLVKFYSGGLYPELFVMIGLVTLICWIILVFSEINKPVGFSKRWDFVCNDLKSKGSKSDFWKPMFIKKKKRLRR